MTLAEVLKEYLKTVQTYKETPFDDLNQTAELMKDLAVILSELTVHKVKYKKVWNAKVYELIREDNSNASSERIASQEIPELDQIRQVIRAGKDVLDAIRSQVSLLKSEK